ncbi:hypothetical protein CLOM_g11608 [Closterium sp. NIES-68]|nr:hypothetical protein CLOM_g11608 [Closterium sp. NIES-68]
MPGLARLPFFPAPAHGPRPPAARAATFGHGTRGVSIVSSSSGGGGGHDGSSSGGSLFPGRFTQSAAPDAPLGTRATGLADVSSSLPWSVLRAAPSCRCTGCALTTAALLLVLFLFLAYRSTLIDPAQQRDPVDSFGSADSSGSVQASAAWTRLWSPGAPAAHAAPHAVAAGGGGWLEGMERSGGGGYWTGGLGTGSGAAGSGRGQNAVANDRPSASVQALLITFSSSWGAPQGSAAQGKGGGEQPTRAASSGNSGSGMQLHMSLELLQCLQWVEYWVRAGVQAVLWADVLPWEHVDPDHPTRDALAHMHAQKQAFMRAYEPEGRVSFHREVMGAGGTRRDVVEQLVARAAHQFSSDWLLVSDSPLAFLSLPSDPLPGFLSRFLAQQPAHVVQVRPSRWHLSSLPLLLPPTFLPRSLFSHGPLSDALLDPDEQDEEERDEGRGEEGNAEAEGADGPVGQETDGRKSASREAASTGEETSAGSAPVSASNTPPAGVLAESSSSSHAPCRSPPCSSAPHHCFRLLSPGAALWKAQDGWGGQGGGEGEMGVGMREGMSGSGGKDEQAAVLLVGVRSAAVRELKPRWKVHRHHHHNDYDDDDAAAATRGAGSNAASLSALPGSPDSSPSPLAHLIFSSPPFAPSAPEPIERSATGKQSQQQQQQQQQQQVVAEQLVSVVLSARSNDSSTSSGRGNGVESGVAAASDACPGGWVEGKDRHSGLLEFQAVARAVSPRVHVQAARVAAAVVHGAVQRLQKLVLRMQQQLGDAQRAAEKSLDELTNEVVSELDVFGATMENGFLCEVDSTGIVAPDGGTGLGSIQLSEEEAEPPRLLGRHGDGVEFCFAGGESDRGGAGGAPGNEAVPEGETIPL